MYVIGQQFISDDQHEESQLPRPAEPDAAAEEADALDAFSRVVVRMAETTMPAVVNIAARKEVAAVPARACCSRPMVFCSRTITSCRIAPTFGCD